MLERFENADPVVCSVFDFFPPAFHKTILKAYFKILDFSPEVYKKMYDWGNESVSVLKIREYVSRYLAKRMYKFISSHKPALIVCTHATTAGLVAYLKRKGKLNAPIATVITDYVVHKLWVYPEFDYYFVATEEMAHYLEEQGIDKTKIKITGIPVTPSFCQKPDKNEICKDLEFDPARPILLLMGGGAGLMPMDKIIENFDKNGIFAKLNFQTIAVTGKNTAMHEKISSLAQKIPQPIKPCGYVENVHELMTVSDILISKAGGVTCAEALASGLPVLICHPLPGQEEANTRYLTNQGAALLADSYSQLSDSLEQILVKEPEKFKELQSNAKNLGRPDAAFDIADCLGRYI